MSLLSPDYPVWFSAPFGQGHLTVGEAKEDDRDAVQVVFEQEPNGRVWFNQLISPLGCEASGVYAVTQTSSGIVRVDYFLDLPFDIVLGRGGRGLKIKFTTVKKQLRHELSRPELLYEFVVRQGRKLNRRT